jgi:galactokinase
MLAGVIGSASISELLTRRESLPPPGHAPAAPTVPTRQQMFAACRAAVDDSSGGRDVRFYFVPGRIEVLGKHTDYCGGHSIVAATEQGFCIAAAARDDHRVNVTALPQKHRIQFDLEPELEPMLGTWANYPMTVGRRLVRNFGTIRGIDVAFTSDLPQAAGLSSSSAMIIAFFLALADANDLWSRPGFQHNVQTPEDLAGYLGTIENGQSFGSLTGDKGVGTFGGSEDHTAILCSAAGRLKMYSYCPVRLEQTVVLPDEYIFAIASSGVVAEKTGAAREKYNDASGLARRVLETWNRHTNRSDPTLASAAARISADAKRGDTAISFETALRQETDGEELIRRLSHFVLEDLAVRVSMKLFTDGQVERLGNFVDESQRGAEDLLGNQTEQTAFLQRVARELDAAAASAFGAGFGGSVWALVWAETAPAFLKNWAEVYRREMPEHAAKAAYFLTMPGRAACRVTGL